MNPEAAEGDRNRGESTQRKTERIKEKNKWKEEKGEYRSGKKDRAGAQTGSNRIFAKPGNSEEDSHMYVGWCNM